MKRPSGVTVQRLTESTHMKMIQYRVCGNAGTFPMDMLRYDHAWPATEDDAHTIHSCLSGDTPILHRVQIVLFGLTCHAERWNSFGWEVREQAKVEVPR